MLKTFCISCGCGTNTLSKVKVEIEFENFLYSSVLTARKHFSNMFFLFNTGLSIISFFIAIFRKKPGEVRLVIRWINVNKS